MTVLLPPGALTTQQPTGYYNLEQLAAIWVRAGGKASQAPMAAAIAMAESGGNPNAINHNTDGSIDRGLWQVNSVHGAQSTLDPLANAKAAVAISSNGSNWNPWVTFKNKKYQQYLSGAQTAAAPLQNDPVTNAASGVANTVSDAVSGLGAIGTALSDIAKIINFVFSYRFIYVISGGVLLLAALWMIMHEQGM